MRNVCSHCFKTFQYESKKPDNCPLCGKNLLAAFSHVQAPAPALSIKDAIHKTKQVLGNKRFVRKIDIEDEDEDDDDQEYFVPALAKLEVEINKEVRTGEKIGGLVGTGGTKINRNISNRAMTAEDHATALADFKREAGNTRRVTDFPDSEE